MSKCVFNTKISVVQFSRLKFLKHFCGNQKTSFPAAVSCHKQVKSTFLQWLIYNHFRFDFCSNPLLQKFADLDMGTFDSWGVNSFISLYLIQAVALSSENSSNYKYQWFIAVVWRISLFYICHFAVWRFFLVKLLRLPPNRKPCDFIKPDCEYPSSVYLTECTPCFHGVMYFVLFVSISSNKPRKHY